MKKSIQIIAGCAVLFAAALFTFTGCPTDGSGVGDSGVPSIVPSDILGETLTISGQQVYSITNSGGMFGQPVYTPISGDRSVDILWADGDAAITNGKLNVTINGAPDQLSELWSLTTGLFNDYKNVTIMEEEAQWTSLTLIAGSDYLSKISSVFTTTSVPITVTSETVRYFYFDRDLTITGTGKTTQTTPESGVTVSTITKDFTLDLKKGWNPIYEKNIYKATVDSSTATVTVTVTATETIAVANPALKWSYYTGNP